MTIDSYESPDAEALLRAGEQRRARRPEQRRERVTQAAAASSFVLAAGLLAVLAPWHRSLSATTLVLVVGTYVAVERVRFPVAGGWTYPTMLAFVPMLFVLPTPVVPLVGMLAILLGSLPGYARRKRPLSRIPSDIADAWYTFVPALVIVLGGAESFSWSHWPVYLAAITGQILFDLAAWICRSWFAERVDPRVQLPLLLWTYLVDATLAPIGLVIAAVAVDRPALVLIGLSPMVMLALLARERQQRLEQTLVLSSAYRGTALLLGEVIEVDDAYTGIHSREVVDLSLSLADALGLGSTVRRNVEFTALLHDVGKIHVPKQILNKPGSLSEAEWDILRRHTVEGERMLRQIGGALAGIGGFVRSSHERFDGGGYPDGLAGEQIPIESRIVAVCDAYNAMTTDRSYQAAMPVAQALAELQNGAGTQFDPSIVELFGRLLAPEAAKAATTQPCERASSPGSRPAPLANRRHRASDVAARERSPSGFRSAWRAPHRAI
jgi:hypothetical protein